MRAVEITKPGDADVLQICERGQPQAGPGQVLIEVAAAGINRPDIFQRRGMYPPPPGVSDIPGLEVSGEIVAVGDDVVDLKRGDAVCALVTGGGYAEYCVADAACCLPVPSTLSLVDAAALPETFFTVWSNVFDRAELKHGETFLVHGGASGIGTAAIQLAHAFGAKVITTVGSDRKVQFCKGIGADLAINYKERDFVEAVMEATDGRGADVILDMVGGDYLPRNISAMADDGRHVSIAFLRGALSEINFAPIMLKRLTLSGSTLRARDRAFKAAIAESLALFVLPLIEEGRIRPVIDSVFPLEHVSDAHTLMESSEHMGKIVLKI